MINFLREILGPNWRSSFLGMMKALILVIAGAPILIDFLPDTWEKIVIGVALLIRAVMDIYGGFNSKDKQVTGTGTGAVEKAPNGSTVLPG